MNKIFKKKELTQQNEPNKYEEKYKKWKKIYNNFAKTSIKSIANVSGARLLLSGTAFAGLGFFSGGLRMVYEIKNNLPIESSINIMEIGLIPLTVFGGTLLTITAGKNISRKQMLKYENKINNAKGLSEPIAISPEFEELGVEKVN